MPSKIAQRQALCRNKFFQFSQVVFDLTSPNLVVVLARQQQALLIYEFKAQGGKQECLARGILRLNEVFGSLSL